MNNQYSRGCGYNYRRSAQRDMNMSRSASYGKRTNESDMNCSIRRATESGTEESCHMEKRSMENYRMEERSMENYHMEQHSMQKPLAMGYVPMQVWSEPLPICRALRIGTIFEELHKPFCGKGGACR